MRAQSAVFAYLRLTRGCRAGAARLSRGSRVELPWIAPPSLAGATPAPAALRNLLGVFLIATIRKLEELESCDT